METDSEQVPVTTAPFPQQNLNAPQMWTMTAGIPPSGTAHGQQGESVELTPQQIADQEYNEIIEASRALMLFQERSRQRVVPPIQVWLTNFHTQTINILEYWCLLQLMLKPFHIDTLSRI